MKLPEIKKLIRNAEPVVKSKILMNLENDLPDLSKLANQIEAAIVAEPPVTIKDGGIIKPGYNKELDSLKDGPKDAKKWKKYLKTIFENKRW